MWRTFTRRIFSTPVANRAAAAAKLTPVVAAPVLVLGGAKLFSEPSSCEVTALAKGGANSQSSSKQGDAHLVSATVPATVPAVSPLHSGSTTQSWKAAEQTSVKVDRTTSEKTDVPKEAPRRHFVGAIERAPESLRADRDFMLQVVRENGEALQYASPDLRRDRGVVLEAVRQNGFALQFAATDLRGDADLVLEAVRQTGLALQFATQDLRSNREIVTEAVRQSGWALEYAAPELHQDPSLMEESQWHTSGY